MELNALLYRLKSLTAFRHLLSEPVMDAVTALIESLIKKDPSPAVSHWGALLAQLDQEGFDGLGGWLESKLKYSDAPWPNAVARAQETPALAAHAKRDIETLTALAEWAPLPLLSQLDLCDGVALPGWTVGSSFTFEGLREWYRSHGAGPFARHRAFLWENAQLLPVEQPDTPSPTDLIGYRLQRSQVEANTLALLSGKRVNNVLLFGDSGTGKSATVKSLLTLPQAGDLRLIEVDKESVVQMPQLIRTLAGRRQKFILFIDDLAFDQDDQTYGVLKTILEGGLEPRPANVAIYATSNRRNLVRQTFSDRAGDEVDRGETIQEKTALADRFGLRIPYLGLAKAEYLELVEHLADQAGVGLPQEELHALAIRWDARHPGRSPRTAQQFIASL